jgi:glycosyltransferase involved in cell wall biosynthesis
MKKEIDVVIATYNRPQKVLALVNEINNIKDIPKKIIVVDSSDIHNNELLKVSNVIYITSRHKNQPFQRLLGSQYSTSEYILFIDDDMKLINKNLFENISDSFSKPEIIAISLYWENKDDKESSLYKLTANVKKKKSNSDIKKLLTFYPNPKIGKVGFCGIRGDYPSKSGYLEFLSGGAFVIKKDLFFINNNFQMLDLHEKQIGKGEDTLIGLSLINYGKIYFEKRIDFLHDDDGYTNYGNSFRQFHKIFIFSRLFLSLENQRIKGKSLLISKIYFFLFSIMRIIPNLFLFYNKNNREVLIGMIQGLILAFKFRYSNNNILIKEKWLNIINKEMKRNENWNIIK